MKSKRSIIHYSVFATLIGLAPTLAYSAMRVGNHSRSYAAAYQQVNAMRNQTATTPGTNVATQQPLVVTPSTDVENNLPVRVADSDLAQQIANGNNDSVAFNQLEQCSMIYPNGEFVWASPTLGAGVGGADTCAAVVELRGYQAGADGSDVVLARATLAAGDTIRCNISECPEATMNVSAVESFMFPADAAPTMDDVIAQMNQEQKQNAGIKIAAGALIGGLGGNMAGANDVGSDSLLGTDKNKIQSTFIGALSGAALMAGNAYAGKVAGDTILSTGVNAAAGSVIGNMSGTGDPVLRIEDCRITENGVERETTCLWGALVASSPLDLSGAQTAFYNIENGDTYVCDKDMKNCKSEQLVSIELEAYPNINIEEIDEYFENVRSDASKQYHMETENGVSVIKPGAGNGIYAKISAAGTIDRQIPAMIEMRDKAFGMNQSDWRQWKRNNSNAIPIYGRSGNGTSYTLPESTNADIQNFYPMLVDAADGSLSDFGNTARLKSTLVGGAVGGALGGLSGYQGAQMDVQNRWVTAVREYEDSLQKVYCATGNRYLSSYNDMVFIPAMTSVTSE